MAFDFPSSPTNGQEYTSGDATYTWNGQGWSMKPLTSGYVLKTGDTMTGPLLLSADPSAALGAATKQYVDTKAGNYVLKTGDTMTGALKIDMGTPTLDLNKGVGASDTAVIRAARNGQYRWIMHLGNTNAESSGNAGSDFMLHAWNDAGTSVISTPLTINRATGKADFTGDITISKVSPALTLAKTASGQANNIYGFTGNNARWVLQLGDGLPESSGNAGSDLAIYGYNDNGTIGGRIFSIMRASGVVNCNYGLYVTNGELRTYGLSGNNNVGVVRFSTNANIYLYWDGTNFNFSGGQITAPGGTFSRNVYIRNVTDNYSGTWLNSPAGGQDRWFAGTEGTGDMWRAYCTAFGNILEILSSGPATFKNNLRVNGAFNVDASSGFTGQVNVNNVLQVSANLNGWASYVINNNAGESAHCLYIRTLGPNAWGIGVLRSDGGAWTHVLYGNGNVSHTGSLSANVIESSAHMRSGNCYWYSGWGGHYFVYDGSTFSIPWGNFSMNGNMTVQSSIDAVRSYQGRQGQGGTAYNVFNIAWVSNQPQLWIDASYCGIITTTSDYRTKKDVANLTSTWDRIKALRPISYTQKAFKYKELFDDNDEVKWGFMAHELQETLIQSAATGVKDDEKAIQSPNIMVLLAAVVKALQEAMQRIEQLEESAHA